ncbi:MAG: adaptor protein MecA [Lachnospiraceae bacterium]|nr:adaptor protein MecA [Lachnospiraceae bacterium]
MRIEKINDRQLRCTLTTEDLASRNINLKEFAYGSDKARELFQDMMTVAAQDFGFEVDNIPLVIEAIPVSMDTIILIVTKVEDPEELDTRFSRFSPENSSLESGFSFADLREHIEGADDILDLIRRISEGRKHSSEKDSPVKELEDSAKDTDAAIDSENIPELMRAYSFRTLDDAIRAAGVLDSVYDGPNSLYKSSEDGMFYLVLKNDSVSPTQFNKVCNILSEYAVPCHSTVGMEAYFQEHFETILAEHALHSLRAIS